MIHKIIALTGGIGSGKSAVAEILRKRGYAVIDCDQISREVSSDSALLAEISELLGADIVQNGVLNRAAVREKVFKDEELYNNYSHLFWNRIKSVLFQRIESAQTQTVFVEIPVLNAFEFPWTEIWVVESDRQIRAQRVMSRDGVSAENVAHIMSRQSEVSDFTRKIFNNGTLADLEQTVVQILQTANF